MIRINGLCPWLRSQRGEATSGGLWLNASKPEANLERRRSLVRLERVVIERGHGAETRRATRREWHADDLNGNGVL